MFNYLKINQSQRNETKGIIFENCKPSLDFYLLAALSAMIATLGLIVDSAAVVIGGMLIAPLFFPTISLSMAVVRGNTKLFEKSFYNLLKAILIVVILSFIVALISPSYGESQEILSRSQPNLLHLFIALFSGAAGAVAITYPKAPTTLAGILVAAALIPPLCVAGVGFSSMDLQIIAGSLLLFVANLLSIVFMGILVFYIFGFAPTGTTSNKTKKIIRTDLIWSAILLLLIAVPLCYALIKTIKNEKQILKTREITSDVLESKNLTAVSNIKITRTKEKTDVQIEVDRLEIPSDEEYQEIKNQLENYLGEDIILELIINPSYRLND